MGKKKAVSANLGKSIIRSRFGKNVNKTGESFLHTSDLADGYDWGRLNLQSVTEQSNLDDFLSTAELAGTEFTAEKLNISIVSATRQSGLLSKSELSEVKEAQQQHKDLLRIPRRPPWNESTTPDELDARERTEFLNWRRNLAELQEVEKILLTPYEKNLDFWRQLWRVIERSDVVVQIVDARNPLLFRCVDLERYVKEVHPDKVNLILINKADYLNETQRKLWSEYFQKEDALVAFWSALEEAKNQEAQNSEEIDEDNPFEMSDDESETDEEDEEENENMEEINDFDDESTDLSSRGDNCQRMDIQSDSPWTASGSNSEMQTESTEPMKSDSARADYSNFSLNQPISDSVCNTKEGVLKSRSETESGPLYSSQTVSDSQSPKVETRNCWDILSGEELLQMLRTIHTAKKVNDNHTTIGMVGYPNVGKSSTINAILQMKKVPVSATPGRTKHFQTLFVEKELMLCDCPGLVFPSFVSTKAELVVNGILSIDQMRDHVPPVALVCQRIPRPVLESVYGVNIQIPGECEDPSRPPTAQEFLNAHGYMRGYMTSNGMPDNPRSSRYVLKDYVNGKLLFCQPPPGVDDELFKPTTQMTDEYSEGKEPDQSENSPAEVKVGSKNKKATVVAQSSVDKEFFKKSDPKLRSKGIRGVTGFVRTNTTGEHIPSASGSTDGSTQNLEAKPWKKHNNRHKKEKSRRIHGDLNA